MPQLIERAASLLGGFDALAKYLGVPEHALRLYAATRATAPANIVVLLVDLILKDDVARAAQDRRQQPRLPDGPESPDQSPPLAS